jgi:hypothetical protein
MTAKSILTGFLIVLLLLAAYVINAGFVVIHVKSPETNLWVPVPIALVRLFGAFISLPIPHDPGVEEALKHREAVEEILSQLVDLPDSDLVEVTKPKEHVRIFKRGNSLYVDVDNLTEKVKVRIPLKTLKHLLRAIDHQSLNVGELAACLAWQPSSDLLHVQHGQEEVRISIW